MGQDRQRLAGLGELSRYATIKAESFDVSDETYVFVGHVELDTDQARIISDAARYRPGEKTVVFTGNVVLSFDGAVLTGDTLTYDVENDTGEIENAFGILQRDGALLEAAKIRRIGKETLEVEKAVFTTCTQPVPYWSFRVGSGRFNLGEYAHLRNVSFKTGKVPIFYSPYLVWPIKSDRAAGLLFPEFTTSDNLGRSITLPIYVPVASNADVTFLLQYYSEVGFGLGAEVEWLPSWNGRARGDFDWINDVERGESRYSVEWEQKQEFENEFRLRSRLEFISDYDYLTDYETDLSRATSPIVRSDVDLTKNWSSYSLSMRGIREEQFFVGGTSTTSFLTQKVVNTQIPEFELRGRSKRVGDSPVFLSFVSSVSGFKKQVEAPPAGQFNVENEDDLVSVIDNGWARADFAPRFQYPILRTPWIDLRVEAGWRGTWYSARVDPLDPEQIVTDSLARSLWSAGIAITGPRIQRVFETPDWDYTPRLKHVVEPFVEYAWRPESSVDQGEVILFDEVDNVPGRLSDVRYGFRQRLFGLRAPETTRPAALVAAEDISFESLDELVEDNEKKKARAEGTGLEEDRLEVAENLQPIELASLEIFQSYSFSRELSREFALVLDPFTGGPAVDPVTGQLLSTVIDSTGASPITALLRVNPTYRNSIDVRYVYDIANDLLAETSISSSIQTPGKGYLKTSWFRRQDPNPAFENDTSFLRAAWGAELGSKLRFENQLDYDLEGGELTYQKYLLTYATQCCSIRLGYDRRDFVDNSRNELLLFVNLSGIGDVLKLREAQGN